MNKVIHYCWFGDNELSDDAKRCIESWRRFCPEYEIKEWNESNYDITKCRYVQEAYSNKKWAFVSDFARFDILYTYGGLYFDTDVELIAPIDDLVQKGSFLGLEKAKKKGCYQINPGLGMYAESNMEIYRRIIEYYNQISFVREDGGIDLTTVCEHINKFLVGNEEIIKDINFKSNNIIIYSTDYFAPLNYYTGELQITANTRSIHHYSESWVSPIDKNIKRVEKYIVEMFGSSAGIKITKVLVMPIYVFRKVKELGIIKTVDYAIHKMIKRK